MIITQKLNGSIQYEDIAKGKYYHGGSLFDIVGKEKSSLLSSRTPESRFQRLTITDQDSSLPGTHMP